MKWTEVFTKEQQPTMEHISQQVEVPYWQELCTFLQKAYEIEPILTYSHCTMAPGWNVKYKKGSMALCSLYPEQKHFYCMVVVRSKDSLAAELLLEHFDPYTKDIYHSTKPMNGSRWLYLEVSNAQILEDIKKLILIRAKPKHEL